MAYEIIDASYVLDNLGKMPILDVRPIDMYSESRIPGAVHASLLEAKEAPTDTSEYFVESVQALGLEPQQEFMVYCYNGGLAREACDILETNGYTGHKCYYGSWIDWIQDSSRPIES